MCARLLRAGSQYNTTHALRGIQCARVCMNRLGFYSCVSCVHVLRCIVNRALWVNMRFPEAVFLSSYYYFVLRRLSVSLHTL